MLILGIDPGTATTGYGFLKTSGEKFEALEFGLIETKENGDPGQRLLEIHDKMMLLLKKYNPDVVAIEKLFFATNAKTAMRVGQAHGVMLYTSSKAKLKCFEYAPGTIKKMVAGDGRADKKEVQRAVRNYLGAKVRSRVKKKTHFDNSADALAVAICHALKLNAKS